MKNKIGNICKKCFSMLNIDILFFTALFLLLFIISNLIISSSMFILGISIQKITIFLSFLISLLVVIFRMKKYKINIVSTCSSILLTTLIIIFSIFLSSKIYDRTCDGNFYHKVSIGMLMDGWNPLKETMKEFEETSDFNYDVANGAIWGEHYAKASHIFAANVSKVTGNIESGKALNIISVFIVFFLVFSLLLKQKKGKIFSLLFSIALVFCPTISTQIFTNYVDILVYLYMFLLIYVFFAFEYNKEYMFENLLIYFSTLIMLINIKFSSFGYAGIYCFGYYIWYIFRYKKNKPFFKKFTFVSAISLIVGVFIVGLSVYPKNFIDHGHPFYPIMGENKIDIMTSNQPDYFKKKSPVEKFVISTFSKMENITEVTHEKATYKIPFTVFKSELKSLVSYDLRISGNGLFFSGILIISLVVLIISLILTFKKDKQKFVLYVIPLGITLILIFVMQDIWWARYFPQLHFFVFASILLSKDGILKWLKYVLLIGLLINNILSFGSNIVYTRMYVTDVDYQYDVIKNNCESKSTLVLDSDVFQGIYYNVRYKLKDYNILFRDIEEQESQFNLNLGTKVICER